MFEKFGGQSKKSNNESVDPDPQLSRRNFLRGAAALTATAALTTPKEAMAEAFEHFDYPPGFEEHESIQAEKIATTLQSQPFLGELASLQQREAADSEFDNLVERTLLEAARDEGVEMEKIREVLIFLFKNNYYVNLDAYKSQDKFVYEMDGVTKGNFSSLPGIQMFSSEGVRGEFFYGAVNDEQFEKTASSQGHPLHGTVLNQSRIKDEIDFYNERIVPKGWKYSIDTTAYAKNILTNEASHIMFPHFFPNLYDSYDDPIEHHFFSEPSFKDADPTVNQIDEFLSDCSSVYTNADDLIRIVNRMVKLFSFNNHTQSIELDVSDQYGYTYAVFNRLLAEKLEEKNFSSLLELFRAPDERFTDLDDSQIKFAAQRILSVLGQDGLAEVAAQMYEHAEKTIEILRQEEQKLAAKK